ncbi:hypothetical protein LINPERHAP1_LOCUS42878 [Linum perenne]
MAISTNKSSFSYRFSRRLTQVFEKKGKALQVVILLCSSVWRAELLLTSAPSF